MAQPQIAELLIDTFTREEPTYEADVTDHPVEKGGDITDNVRPKPNMLTVDGIVSDAPIGAARAAAASLASPTANTRARLREIYTTKQPVTVVTTSGERWDNMILQTLTMPQDASTGLALVFTAKFKQITVVETERTQVRVAVPSHAGEQDRGHQATQSVDIGPILDSMTKAGDATKRFKSGDPRAAGLDTFGIPNQLGHNIFDTNGEGIPTSEDAH